MRVLAWPAFCNRLTQPYNSLLYTPMTPHCTVDEFSWGRLFCKQYDVFHLHWPDSVFHAKSLWRAMVKAVLLLVLIDLARWRGTRMVWTVHNLQSHERNHPRLETWFWPQFTRRLDAYISLSEYGARAAVLRFPPLASLPGHVVHLGHYRDVYPNTSDRSTARRVLGIADDQRVLLFMGLIRPYKNVSHLIRVVKSMDDSNLLLVIAGKPSSSDLVDEMVALAGNDSRVRLNLDFVPEDRVHLYMNAADLVVLPYREVLNSSAAILALSFDKPVLVPEKGAMGDLRNSVGNQWVRTYTGDLSPEEVGAALSWVREQQQGMQCRMTHLDWETLSQETLEVYRGIISR